MTDDVQLPAILLLAVGRDQLPDGLLQPERIGDAVFLFNVQANSEGLEPFINDVTTKSHRRWSFTRSQTITVNVKKFGPYSIALKNVFKKTNRFHICLPTILISFWTDIINIRINLIKSYDKQKYNYLISPKYNIHDLKEKAFASVTVINPKFRNTIEIFHR